MRVRSSVDQKEKEQSVKLRTEEKTVTLEEGALADLRTSTNDITVAIDRFRPLRQGDT